MHRRAAVRRRLRRLRAGWASVAWGSENDRAGKLDFLSRVAGMSTQELSNAASLFAYSLDGRLRPRYFYALQRGTVHRWKISTLMLEADQSYVAYALGRGNGTTHAF